MKNIFKTTAKVIFVLTTALFIAEIVTETSKRKNNQEEYWD